jgi:hypothetical protein
MSIKMREIKSKHALVVALPKPYQSYASLLKEELAPFLLVIFDDDVINSGQIKKAIKNNIMGCTLVVVGENFTQEARDLMEDSNVIALALRDFHWTDASHARIKQFGGPKVKPREKIS